MTLPSSIRLTAKGMAVLGSVLLLAGCGSGESGSDDTIELTDTTPPGQQEVDLVRWNLIGGEPPSLDPIYTYNYAPNTVLANICESLHRLNPDFSYTPALATKVSNPNPTTWVYEIRDGVKFSDGEPLTAEDVAYSLERSAGPSSYWAIWYQNVKRIEATGPLEVTVTLTQPDVLFDQFMATAAGAITQKKATQAAGEQLGTPQQGPTCTGPFTFEQWTPGQSIVLQRNDEYWDTELQPKVNELEFQFIQNSQTLTNALDNDQLDGAYFSELDIVPALQRLTTGNAYFGPSFRAELIAPLTDKGLMGDTRILQALSLSIDRAALSETVLHGAASPLTILPAPPSWAYAEAALQEYVDSQPASYDVDKARSLVEQAGSPTTPITIAVESVGAQNDIASVIADDASKVGLNVEIKPLSSSQFNDIYFSPETRKKYDAFLQNEYPDLPDPLEPYTYTVLPDSDYNYSGYSNPTVTKLVDQAWQTTDEAERADLIVEAQSILDKDLPLIPLTFNKNVLFMNQSISGAPASYVEIYYPWGAAIGGTDAGP